MPDDMPSAEEIARHYNAMIDSVIFINSFIPTQDAKDLYMLDLNVRHLETMLRYDWWSGYNLDQISAAIVAGKQ
jgi:hypothetical protein